MGSQIEPAANSNYGDKHTNINWDKLGFDLIPADYMYMMTCCDGETFSNGALRPYQKLELHPSSAILNYGQGLLEGLKAYRRGDGRVMLFRPEENARRMKMGAERICMPSPSVEQFVHAVKQTVLANKHMVPPPGKGSLYIRPLLMGTGPVLAMGPAPEFTFLIYASPVGDFHKARTPLNLLIQEKIHRATPGGTGGIKCITNYSPVFKPIKEAKAQGFSDVLFLDAVTGKYIEEASSCNIFIVKGDTISTPAIAETILPGITRKSIIDIALDFGYQVQERLIVVEELTEADEVFCTGTAVGVVPVGSVTYQGKRFEYGIEAVVTKKLQVALLGIQTGLVEDKMGWTCMLD
ncbi:branched-chain amino acid aminotransferase 2, chloroplastic-like [Punica granatum]|uniref:Branched-chain-amino-acid aminotransferase n=2 Tax=Punica granatum TaxID=22663 RepID=A0A6P8D628_PUNGR|nr:branched-chain amino acid aminotransferase 2, chloroplastic-like [Punica granatum]